MKAHRLVELAKQLMERGGSLESGAASGPISDERLTEAIAKRIAERTPEGELETELAPVPAISERIKDRARKALDRATSGVSGLDDSDLASLEVIVRLVGRPALRFPGGHLEAPDDIGGENVLWQVLIATDYQTINKLSRSVGRIDLEPPGSPVEPIGTGWRIGSNLIVTNRHVLRRLVQDPNSPIDEWLIDPAIPAIIDFDADNPNSTERTSIATVGWCSNDKLDIAVLVLRNSSTAFPDPLPLRWEASDLGRTIDSDGAASFQGKQIYVIGYPYVSEVTSPTSQVFGKADGTQRFAPGFATAMESAKPIFEHDCSTLGGNSGSPVFSVDYHAVVGLHFGAEGAVGDGTGTSNDAIALSKLTGTRAWQILLEGHV